MMKFSIIIVTYNNHRELFDCLESITRCHIQYPFEVIVIFNGDRSYLEKCSQTFKKFSLLYTQKTTPASARNLGISKAKGEFLFFLNDDCTLPRDYFTSLNFENNWDVLGGSDQTAPHSTSLQQIIGKALSSPLCMGPFYKRHTQTNEYQTSAPESSLTLSNLWIKSSLFTDELFDFNPKIYRNELILFLKELKNKNKIFHYQASLYVFQQRKKNLENLGAQILQNAESRMQSLALMPQLNDVYYLLPLIWLILFCWIIFHPQNILGSLFIIYTAAIAIYYMLKYRGFSLRYIFLHYFILGSYSIGIIVGFCKFYLILYNNLRENKSFIKESKSR